jgi:hypothetical protein
MNRFNYMPASPYLNPAGGIEKTTNELPAEEKTTTRTRKRNAKKNTRKGAKKNEKSAKKAE